MVQRPHQHLSWADAAGFVWYGVQLPNAAGERGDHIFHSTSRCHLQGVLRPSRSCHRDVVCVASADPLSQIAWVPCLLLLSLLWRSRRAATRAPIPVSQTGCGASCPLPPLRDKGFAVQAMLGDVLLNCFWELILNGSFFSDALSQVCGGNI